MPVRRYLRLLPVVAVLLAIGCASSTTPTPTPPPTEDPPKVTCPAAQTIQLKTGSSIAVTFANPTILNGKPPVTSTCTRQSGSLFDIGTTGVSCTVTDALQRTDTCAFSVTVLAPLPPPVLIATSFLAFGDSITWGEDGRNSALETSARLLPRVQLPFTQTYPGVLLKELSDRYTTQIVTVDNGGRSGEAITDAATSDTPTARSRFDGLLRGHGVVLIMEGTNDLAKAHVAANRTAQDNILAGAATGLGQMVRDAKSSGARPFLATIAPMNPTGSRGQTFGWDLVMGFNERVATLAANEDVPLVDVNKAFGGNLSLLGADGVHPTAEGYKVIADAFLAAIESTLETKSTVTTRFRRR
jgi:lysophospholipase L1-like esterase